MKKVKRGNIVEVSECKFSQVMHLITDWMASDRDVKVNDQALKGWINYGSSFLRWDSKSTQILMAFRVRDAHNPRQLAYSVDLMDRFIMKRFSNSFSEFHDQGYKYGIQLGSEKYLFFAWRIPRYQQEVTELYKKEETDSISITPILEALCGNS